MLTHLDDSHLNKLLKIAPEKMKGIPLVSKSTSKQVRNKLFNHLANKKNISVIVGFIENGGFHDILENDLKIYNDIEFNNYQDFFSSLKGKGIVVPYTMYIYLIEKGTSRLEDFFINGEGLQDFKNKAKQYSSDTILIKQEEVEDKTKKRENELLEEISLLNNYLSENRQKNTILERENKNLKVKLEKKNIEKQNIEKKYKEKNEKSIAELIEKYEVRLIEVEKKLSQEEKKNQSYREKDLALKKDSSRLKQKIVELEEQNNQIRYLKYDNKVNFNEKIINKSKVLLIGNPNISKLRNDIYFYILDPDTEVSKIEDVLNNNNFEEMWLISFQLHPRQRKIINQNFQKNIKIKKVDDLSKLE